MRRIEDTRLSHICPGGRWETTLSTWLRFRDLGKKGQTLVGVLLLKRSNLLLVREALLFSSFRWVKVLHSIICRLKVSTVQNQNKFIASLPTVHNGTNRLSYLRFSDWMILACNFYKIYLIVLLIKRSVKEPM